MMKRFYFSGLLVFLFHLPAVAQQIFDQRFPQPNGDVEAVETTDSLIYIIGDFSGVQVAYDAVKVMDENNNPLPFYADLADHNADNVNTLHQMNKLNDSLLFIQGDLSHSRFLTKKGLFLALTENRNIHLQMMIYSKVNHSEALR